MLEAGGGEGYSMYSPTMFVPQGQALLCGGWRVHFSIIDIVLMVDLSSVHHEYPYTYLPFYLLILSYHETEGKSYFNRSFEQNRGRGVGLQFYRIWAVHGHDSLGEDELSLIEGRVLYWSEDKSVLLKHEVLHSYTLLLPAVSPLFNQS